MVIGLPVNMDGSEGPSAERARQFGSSMLEHKELLGGEQEIAFWDERLSTSAVQRMMIDADMTRKRRAEVVDKMAAAYILQGALDALGRLRQDQSAPVHPADLDEDDDGMRSGTDLCPVFPGAVAVIRLLLKDEFYFQAAWRP